VEHGAAESGVGETATAEGASQVAKTDTPVGNGSMIEVHSGKARVQLADGGSIYICGPAKVSLLDHGGTLMLALEFGTVHVTEPGDEPLRVFTPFFAATPESMDEGPRDFTVGLKPSGRLCVRAQHGGVRLEQQLTGNVLTVPEPTEIFLEGGGVTAQRNDVGHCVCDVAESDLALPAVPAAESAVAGTSSNPTNGAVAGPPGVAQPPALTSLAGAELSIPAHPAPTDSDNAAAAPPEPVAATPPAEYKVEAPPLTYSYKVPYPLPDLSVETVLLARESHVEASQVFHGHVGKKAVTMAGSASRDEHPPEAPKPSTSDTATVHPPGNGSSAGASQQIVASGAPKNSKAAVSASTPAAKPHGFWAKVKHFFGGKSEPAD